jgi:hypothetical protein
VSWASRAYSASVPVGQKKTNSDSTKLNMQKKVDAKKVNHHKAVNWNLKECKVWGTLGDDYGVMMVHRGLSSRKGQFILHP